MIFGAILAGGIGRRIEKHSIPKQFISIGGTPIIVYTLRQFLNNSQIEFVYVAVHNDWISYAKQLFETEFSKDEISKIKVVTGGAERLDSFINIMDDIVAHRGVNDEDILICHDSVRPFINQQIIDKCIFETKINNLALVVIPINDTVYCTEDSRFITGTVNRNSLRSGQTPSGFKLKLLYESCKTFTEDEKKNITGTMQLMLKLGYKIKIVDGHTSNFKITTDNDLDVAERVVSGKPKTRKIELLDCTLRDGGIVIDFDFGDDHIQDIKKRLENACVDFIECGYINQFKGVSKGKTCFDNEISIQNSVLYSGKKQGIQYVAMIDYGTYDLSLLRERNNDGIDGIRFAFHKENWKDALLQAKTISNKGYDLYIQPMVSMRYSDEEFIELIKCVNEMLPETKAFYLVDSFGQMDALSLMHKFEIADEYVSMNMKIGFHAHNNRQMAFSNACEFVKHNSRHNIMIDSSIMGMGKGAGNLCTELIIPVLKAEGFDYDSTDIYNSIAGYFSKIIKDHPWGYCLDYYLSSLYGCTPSYIKIFNKDKRVTTDALVELLKGMPDDKKVACDKEFASNYLENYFIRRK